MIANHFSSKGGDEPLFGRFQPPIRIAEVAASPAGRRRWTGSSTSCWRPTSRANVIVLGDINDFEFSGRRASSRADGADHCSTTLPQAERYTYVFEGNSQVLDHILISRTALPKLRGFDIVHVNAEFADQASDHDPSVARLELDD